MEMNAGLHRLLCRQLARAKRAAPQAHAAGLSDSQLSALRHLAWLPGAPGPALLLGFADGCVLPDRLVLAGGCLAVRAERALPCQLHGAMQVINASRGREPGTLTGLVRSTSNGALFALTAGHVLGGDRDAAAGDRIELSVNGTARTVNGKLDSWAPAFYGGNPDTDIDAGLASIDAEMLAVLMNQGLQLPRGIATLLPRDNMVLRTRTAQHAATALGYVSVWVDLCNGGSQLDYHLQGGMAYACTGTPEPGDSGAPLWDADDNLLAMHVGGGIGGVSGNGVAVPITRVLDFLRCAVVTRGATATAPVPLAMAPAPVLAMAASPQSSQGILARTLWGEARGEGRDGMAAVASVVLNRVKRQTYWGRTVEEVCRKPYQFSCWNANDPNRVKLLAAVIADPGFTVAEDISAAALRHELADNTAGATHYHARGLRPLPRWASNHLPCATIGQHLFYNDIN